MTAKQAQRLLRRRGFAIETTRDGHCIVLDGAKVIGKMRNKGDVHISLQRFIEAGFQRPPSSSDRYMGFLTPDDELLFWDDRPDAGA